jgi:[protein-PII] uridylyltransferase
VTRDFYHRYTVDEHTLLTIRGIERLLGGEQPARGRFSSVLTELRAPELLGLALLYHDVGKWRDEQHAEESVRMAQAMLDRMEIVPAARQDVEFLIAQHLQMSRAAFRRDSDDPAVVRQFAQLVGTEERLKMLCLLTLVDIEAVNAAVLTPWKEELLWRLYVNTYNELTFGYGDEVIEHGQAAVAALEARRPADISAEELTQFLEGFPQRYLTLCEPERIYGHVRLARDIRADAVHSSLERKGDVWELTLITLDKPFLFSNVSGVLAYYGMNILRGAAMTNPAGLVLDVFQFTDGQSFLRLNRAAAQELRRTLADVVAGRTDVAALIARKEAGVLNRRPPRAVEPAVLIDNEYSQRYTVLELVAEDAPGLLHRISRLISRHGCDVDLVLISTEGNRAIDVFHITKAGAKLAPVDQSALRDDLYAALGRAT